MFSVNDREVEFVMKKSNYLPPNSGLTPSPSPLFSDILDTADSLASNDTDAYIESFSFLMEDDVTRPISPNMSTPPTQDNSPYRLTELSNFRPVVETISTLEPLMLPARSEIQEYPKPLPNADDNNTIQSTTSLQQPCKRAFDIGCVSLDKSPLKRTKPNRATPNAMPVRGNIELPLGKTPVAQVKKPQARRVSRVMKSRATVEPTCSDESAAASLAPNPGEDNKSRKKPLVTKPQVSQVALNMNAEGTPVFVIHPATPSPAPKPSTTKKLSTSSATRSSRPKKTAVSLDPQPTQKKPAVKTYSRKNDRFCIQSLVDKFIQAANNKKLPDPKTP